MPETIDTGHTLLAVATIPELLFHASNTKAMAAIASELHNWQEQTYSMSQDLTRNCSQGTPITTPILD